LTTARLLGTCHFLVCIAIRVVRKQNPTELSAKCESSSSSFNLKAHDNKYVNTDKDRNNQAGKCTYGCPINNNTSIKHQKLNKAYNIKENINSKISRGVIE